jgi:hypothetical protein
VGGEVAVPVDVAEGIAVRVGVAEAVEVGVREGVKVAVAVDGARSASAKSPKDETYPQRVPWSEERLSST